MIINVLGREVEIEYCSHARITALSEDPASIGYFDGNKIYIKDTLVGDQRQRVLKHELVHAVLAFSGLTNLLADELEEAIADAMEGLPQI